jgi:hypothetical protein
MSYRLSTVCLILIVFTFSFAANAEEKKSKETKTGSKKAKEAQVIFDKIKSLAGDWVATKGEHKGNVALSLRVIAGGSAVVEREFPGTPQEMITVFHLDGSNLMVNHYCMLGNQPRYKAKMDENDNTIRFEFAGVTNASKNDAHMHEGQLKIVDKDTITSTWVMFKDGKSAGEHVFELSRKK